MESIISLSFLLNNTEYVLLLGIYMIIIGLIKHHDLFAAAYYNILKYVKNKKLVVFLISLIGGVLPISGRVMVSAGLLDTISCKHCLARKKFGIIDYLATHHYYLWSPLEKTVILPMAILSIGYLSWFEMIFPILLVSLIFIFAYIWTHTDDNAIAIKNKLSGSAKSFSSTFLPFVASIVLFCFGANPLILFSLLLFYYILLTKDYNFKRLISFLDLKLLFVLFAIIILSNVILANQNELMSLFLTDLMQGNFALTFFILSALTFALSFVMGSSGKFVAISLIASSIVGMQYFIWFFTLDFVAYLLSPTHKCVIIGHKYFNTPIKSYYKIILLWGLALLITAGIMVIF